MAARRKLELTREQKAELEKLRDHSSKPYLRERAGALLKIAAGMSPNAVAQHGLLKPRASDTVYDWLERYENEGVKGLTMREGRGRKPAFSPSAPKR